MRHGETRLSIDRDNADGLGVVGAQRPAGDPAAVWGHDEVAPARDHRVLTRDRIEAHEAVVVDEEERVGLRPRDVVAAGVGRLIGRQLGSSDARHEEWVAEGRRERHRPSAIRGAAARSP